MSEASTILAEIAGCHQRRLFVNRLHGHGSRPLEWPAPAWLLMLEQFAHDVNLAGLGTNQIGIACPSQEFLSVVDNALELDPENRQKEIVEREHLSASFRIKLEQGGKPCTGVCPARPIENRLPHDREIV